MKQIQSSDATVDRNKCLGRVFLAVMLDGNPIGEVILKHIDVKNKGYGTQAEILSLRYAFEEMHLDIVYADVFRKNKQSQHVLTKVGFTETHRDDTFIYYQCKIAAWSMPSRPESTELQ